MSEEKDHPLGRLSGDAGFGDEGKVGERLILKRCFQESEGGSDQGNVPPFSIVIFFNLSPA